MIPLLADPKIMFQFFVALIALGGILAQVQFLKKDVAKLQTLLQNGLSTEIKTIAITVGRIEATCAERARHPHACERQE
jgi:hypothetical protein